MLDERTMRAGERAAAARRQAFETGETGPVHARPLGVVPVIVLCLVGAMTDAYATVAFDLPIGYAAVSVGLVAFALLAATALATNHAWGWTIAWVYLALHVFFDLITTDFLGPVAIGVALVYALALMYATTRRAAEVIEDAGSF